jgi:hypothetical protein
VALRRIRIILALPTLSGMRNGAIRGLKASASAECSEADVLYIEDDDT